jgi:ABC-2 type transport system ATP-binding protein
MIPLNISQISKTFNKTVLDDINFTVNNGEIFGFIGLNGQGKTTLIKIILDLLDQDDGEVKIFGASKILPKSRQKICYLPEKFQPAIHQTGFEFLEFALGFYKNCQSSNSNKFSKHNLKAICQNLDLDPQALDLKISKYSKGMMQKLGLLATFLSNADLIILDEPMSGLDPKARIALKKELINYKKLKKTIFFSSHILADMDEICDQIAVLHDAKIRFTGSPKEFKDKHKKNDLDQAFLAEILA